MKNTTTEQKSMKNIEVMKNITAMEKTAIEKTTTKNNNNCLAVFFAIIHLDDELKSPSSAE